MKVLFFLHGGMSSNSGAHVHGLCFALVARGVQCAVAVPRDPAAPGDAYRVVTHDEALAGNCGFSDGGLPDLVHAWTPRECIRIPVEAMAARHGVPYLVHLEDHEETLAADQLGRRKYDLFRVGLDPAGGFPPHLSHPVASRRFMAGAAGMTVLIDPLGEMVPAGVPKATFWPASDDGVFHPRPADPGLRQELGVPAGHLMITYHGNVHNSNLHEVMSLYTAVALLNREDLPTRLVRAGVNHVTMDPSFAAWADGFASNLGFIADRQRLGAIVAEADILIQPGLPGTFNDYRFPSKVPDFFASGKPVILPRANIGLVAEHDRDAWIVARGDAVGIADAVKAIAVDPFRRERLAGGARSFYERQLSWRRAAGIVAGLYASALERRRSPA
jgi:glycosyltransferase involved in cell wall biosynthesis